MTFMIVLSPCVASCGTYANYGLQPVACVPSVSNAPHAACDHFCDDHLFQGTPAPLFGRRPPPETPPEVPSEAQRPDSRAYFTPTARTISCRTEPPRSSLAEARSDTEAASRGTVSVPLQEAWAPVSGTVCQVAPSS